MTTTLTTNVRNLRCDECGSTWTATPGATGCLGCWSRLNCVRFTEESTEEGIAGYAVEVFYEAPSQQYAWAARIQSMPGCIFRSFTRDGALRSLREAFPGYVQERRDLGLPVLEHDLPEGTCAIIGTAAAPPSTEDLAPAMTVQEAAARGRAASKRIPDDVLDIDFDSSATSRNTIDAPHLPGDTAE